MKTEKEIKEGNIVLAFDNQEWSKTGDIGDNSQFYKEAEIISIYYHVPMLYGSSDWVADIKWKHSGQFSKGHFLSGLKLIL